MQLAWNKYQIKHEEMKNVLIKKESLKYSLNKIL